MKGNFGALVLVLIGAIALAANLGWIQLDVAGALRTWWPLGLIVLGVALYLTPQKEGQRKSD